MQSDIYKINRLEIIDHTEQGRGRAFTKWEDVPFLAEVELQDGEKTLKIFLTKTVD